MASEGRVAVIAALLGNLLIALLKLAAGLVSNSAAMLAEAAHSFSDVGNQILLLVGLHSAQRPPTPEHPYGTSKSAYFWPFMVAILLFGVAGGYSLVEGVEKVLHPHDVGDVRLSLGVLGASFVIEAVSLAVAARQAVHGARARGVLNTRQFLLENRDATLLTVLVEDALALVGLPVAALALVATKLTGNAAWDGLGSLLIGVLLMGFAVFLGREAKQLLLGRGLSERDRRTVERVITSDPAIVKIDEYQSMYLGPTVVLLGAEVIMRPELSGEEIALALGRLEKTLVQALPMLRFVYLEPTNAPDPAATMPPKTGHADLA